MKPVAPNPMAKNIDLGFPDAWDDEFEAELADAAGLPPRTPSPKPQELRKKGEKGIRGKSSNRRSSSIGAPKKKKAVSASAVDEARSVSNPPSFLLPFRKQNVGSPLAGELLLHSVTGSSELTPSLGPSRLERAPTPPRIPALNVASTPPTPVVRRRRARASEELIWDGIDPNARSDGKKKQRQPLDNRPYSRDHRARRRKGRVEEQVMVPGCFLSPSRTVTASPTTAKGKARRARKRRGQDRNASLPHSSVSSATQLPDVPELRERTSATETLLSAPDDDCSELQFCSLTVFDDQSGLPELAGLSDKDVMTFLQSALADILGDPVTTVSAT